MSQDPRGDLRYYLQQGRDSLLWKLDGLSEYDARRPMTPTGTNVLGLVKHVASMEIEYLGGCFDRPFPDPLPWFADGAEVNADMWVTAEESRQDIVRLYRRAWAHSDATIEELPLDTRGTVPWWPEGRHRPTLHHLIVRVISETDRHAGHVDILRELIDGSAGLVPGRENMAPGDAEWWASYVEKVEAAARAAGAAD